jgi:hypothetical protein
VEAAVTRTRLSPANANAHCIAPMLDHDRRLHVVFWNSASPADDQLLHAVASGTSFDVETVLSVDGNGGFCSGAVDGAGLLHTGLQIDEFGADGMIADAVFDGQQWWLEDLSMGVDHGVGGLSSGSMGDTSMAAGPDGTVRAAYHRGFDGSLWLATRSAAGTWSSERVAGDPEGFPRAGLVNRFAVGPDGTQLILFEGDRLTEQTFDVGHVYGASRAGAGDWEVTELADDGLEMHPPVFDADGVAHVVFIEYSDDAVQLVTWDGGWSMPEPVGHDGDQVAAALGPGGELHLLVYGDEGFHWLRRDATGAWVDQVVPVMPEPSEEGRAYVKELRFSVDSDGLTATYIADGVVYLDRLVL